jgi:hypothetical protein
MVTFALSGLPAATAAHHGAGVGMSCVAVMIQERMRR